MIVFVYILRVSLGKRTSSSRKDVICYSSIMNSECFNRKYEIFSYPLFFFCFKAGLNVYFFFFQIGALLGGDLNNSNGGCPSPVRK